MSFRQSLLAICPPWLVDIVGEKLMTAFGLQLDLAYSMTLQAAKASLPGQGTPTALALIGADDYLDKYPIETDDEYAIRLQTALDTLRGLGGPRELINQLQVAFRVPVRIVNNDAFWVSRSGLTGSFVKHLVSPTNWNWDGLARPWRAWVIMDMSAGPWTNDGLWGSGGLWGDGGVWNSSATQEDVKFLKLILKKWNSNHSHLFLIVCYNAADFLMENAAPPNPNGIANTPAWQILFDAAFGGFIA